MVVDQIEKKGLNLNEAWIDGVAIKVGTSLVNQESSMMHSSSTSSSPTTVIMVPFMGNLRH